MRILSVVLVTAIALIFAAPPPHLWAKGAKPFAKAQIRFEKNATGNDLGIQVDLDGEAWKQVEIFNPHGRKILEVEGKGSLRKLGLTELFLESHEPSLDEVPLEELLALFPEGQYTFIGTTVEGQRLVSKARLTHDIPDGPVIVSPAEGAEVNRNSTVITWEGVITPKGIEIVAYQVIVEGGDPLRTFSVHLPATSRRVTVPREFLERRTEYKFEVLAIEVSGNQTITEGSFRTR